MSKKDFEQMGIKNFVVFRDDGLSNCYGDTCEGYKYVKGHRYYIITCVYAGDSLYANVMDSCRRTFMFNSVASRNLQYMKYLFMQSSKKVYQGKDLIDAIRFVESQGDAERYEPLS